MNHPATILEDQQLTLQDIELNADKASSPLATRARELLDIAKGFKIDSPATQAKAVELAKEWKNVANRIEDERTSLVKPLNDHVKMINAKFKPHADTISEAIGVLRKKSTDYSVEMERKAREEQARIEEQARKERERLEKRAAQALESGHTEKAEALQEQADQKSITPVVEAPKVKGASISKTWVGEVTDIKALCSAIAQGLIPPTFLVVAQKEVDAYAKATKGQVTVPGIRFHEKANTSFR